MYDRIDAKTPAFFFKPKDLSLDDEYRCGWTVGDIFKTVATGIKFRKDNLLVRSHFSVADVTQMLFDIVSLPPNDLLTRYNFAETGDWQLSEKRRFFDPQRTGDIRRIAYRPLDHRFAYYPLDVINQIIVRGDSRVGTAKHLLLIRNVALIVKRSRMINVDHFCHVGVVSAPPDLNYLADQSYFAPLYTFASNDSGLFQGVTRLGDHDTIRAHNLSDEFVNLLAHCYGLTFCSESVGDLCVAFGPEDIFHYIYAVFHSPGYRSRYAELLKIDFPRVPLTSSLDLFRELARLGGELVALHLLESPKLEDPITEFIGNPSPVVERVGFTPNVDAASSRVPEQPPSSGASQQAAASKRTTPQDAASGVAEKRQDDAVGSAEKRQDAASTGVGTVWIDAPANRKGQPPRPGTIGFRGVPEDVWNFHIGGYQVCQKWLKDRKGRTLSEEDIAHYQKIVVALNETIRIMAEIDDVIDQHGGWPGAFVTSSDGDS